MRRVRLSIGNILILIAIFGVGFAALKHPSSRWSGGLLLGDVCLFVFALMAIGYRRGAKRAFWVGFALFGWVYLVIAHAPVVREVSSPFLLTTRALQKARPEVQTIFFAISLQPPPSSRTVPAVSPGSTAATSTATLNVKAVPTATIIAPSATFTTAARPSPAPMLAPNSSPAADSNTAAAASNASAAAGPVTPPPPTSTMSVTVAPTVTARVTAGSQAKLAQIFLATPTASSSTAQFVATPLVSSGTDPREFYRVGHALSALVAAILGGVVARLLFVNPVRHIEGEDPRI
jgi:hypothetical protein